MSRWMSGEQPKLLQKCTILGTIYESPSKKIYKVSIANSSNQSQYALKTVHLKAYVYQTIKGIYHENLLNHLTQLKTMCVPGLIRLIDFEIELETQTLSLLMELGNERLDERIKKIHQSAHLFKVPSLLNLGFLVCSTFIKVFSVLKTSYDTNYKYHWLSLNKLKPTSNIYLFEEQVGTTGNESKLEVKFACFSVRAYCGYESGLTLTSNCVFSEVNWTYASPQNAIFKFFTLAKSNSVQELPTLSTVLARKDLDLTTRSPHVQARPHDVVEDIVMHTVDSTMNQILNGLEGLDKIIQGLIWSLGIVICEIFFHSDVFWLLDDYPTNCKDFRSLVEQSGFTARLWLGIFSFEPIQSPSDSPRKHNDSHQHRVFKALEFSLFGQNYERQRMYQTQMYGFHLYHELLDFIEKCLKHQPTARMEFEQINEQPLYMTFCLYARSKKSSIVYNRSQNPCKLFHFTETAMVTLANGDLESLISQKVKSLLESLLSSQGEFSSEDDLRAFISSYGTYLSSKIQLFSIEKLKSKQQDLKQARDRRNKSAFSQSIASNLLGQGCTSRITQFTFSLSRDRLAQFDSEIEKLQLMVQHLDRPNELIVPPVVTVSMLELACFSIITKLYGLQRQWSSQQMVHEFKRMNYSISRLSICEAGKLNTYALEAIENAIVVAVQEKLKNLI